MSCRVPVRAGSPGHAEASRASSPLSRLSSCRGAVAARGGWFILGGLLAAGPGAAASTDTLLPPSVEVVVTGIPRPIQLVLDAKGGLVVLGQGWRGDAAGEIYRIDLRGSLPVDGTRAPRVVIPFAGEPRKTSFGSLA